MSQQLLKHMSDTQITCFAWQQFKAIAKIKQQSIVNGNHWTGWLCCFNRGKKRVNSLLTLVVYTLSVKLGLGDESEFEEGSCLHLGVIGEDLNRTHKRP